MRRIWQTVAVAAMFWLLAAVQTPRAEQSGTEPLLASQGSVASAQLPRFGWDPVLLNAPRPSPLPVEFGSGSGFHRNLVQLVDGGLRLSFVDVLLPAGLEPLAIKRQYRSGLRTDGVFGPGWTSNLDVRLTMAEAGTVRIVESDGRTTGYEARSAEHYEPIIGTFPGSELVRSSDMWVRRWSDGRREIFDTSGRLRREHMNGSDGVRLSYSSPTSRHPASIIDASGHVAKLVYRDGLLVEVSYPVHRTIRYVYEHRLLTKVLDTIGRETRFSYADGRMSSLALPGGAKLGFDYAPNGTLREVSAPGRLRATFEWSIDPATGAVQLVASPSSGNAQTTEIVAAAVDTAFWGIEGKTPILALQLRQATPGQEFNQRLPPRRQGAVGHSGRPLGIRSRCCI